MGENILNILMIKRNFFQTSFFILNLGFKGRDGVNIDNKYFVAKKKLLEGRRGSIEIMVVVELSSGAVSQK